MRVVVMRLGAKGEQSEDDAIRLLSKLFSVKRSVENKKRMLDEEFHIDVTEEIKKEVDDMCNLSEGIYQRGLEEGKLAGIAEGERAGRLAGIAEGKRAGRLAGIAEGRQEGKQEMLFSLVRNKVLSVRAAAKQSKMPLADFKEQYKRFLEAGPEIK